MEGSTSRSHDSGGAGAAQETLATAEPAEVAVNATAVAVAGAAGGATKLVPLATTAGPAILRAVRGTLDRNCGIAAVTRPPEDGYQSRQARRDRPPGAVAKTARFGAAGRSSPSPIAAWIALRGGFTG